MSVDAIERPQTPVLSKHGSNQKQLSRLPALNVFTSCRSVNSLRDFFVGPTEVNTEARNEN